MLASNVLFLENLTYYVVELAPVLFVLFLPIWAPIVILVGLIYVSKKFGISVSFSAVSMLVGVAYLIYVAYAYSSYLQRIKKFDSAVQFEFPWLSLITAIIFIAIGLGLSFYRTRLDPIFTSNTKTKTVIAIIITLLSVPASHFLFALYDGSYCEIDCLYGLPVPFVWFSDYVPTEILFLFVIGLTVNVIFWFIFVSFIWVGFKKLPAIGKILSVIIVLLLVFAVVSQTKSSLSEILAPGSGRIYSAVAATMSSMRAEAELAVDDTEPGNPYPLDLCFNALAESIDYVESKSKNKVHCAVNGEHWIAQVKINSDQSFCVDNSGFSGQGKAEGFRCVEE